MSGAARRLRAPGAIGEQRSQRGGESRFIARRYEDPCRPMVHDIGDSTDSGAHHGFARGHRFDDADRRSLVARGERNDVCCRVHGPNIALPTEKPTPRPQAERGASSSRRVRVAVADEECERGSGERGIARRKRLRPTAPKPTIGPPVYPVEARDAQCLSYLRAQEPGRLEAKRISTTLLVAMPSPRARGDALGDRDDGVGRAQRTLTSTINRS